MEHIVLNTNLKFVITRLDSEQLGKLLTALLEVNDSGLDSEVGNIYKYIMLLQEEILNKKQRMREIGAKGGASKKKKAEIIAQNDDTLNNGIASLKQCLSKRKVTKENNIYNKNIKSLFIKNKDKILITDEHKEYCKFIPPLVDEVNDFIQKEGLLISADDFVDFYESRGWCMGHVPIHNWQAVAKLWHRRVKNKPSCAQKNSVLDDDEHYWQELSSRIASQSSSEIENVNQIKVENKTSSSDLENEDANLSPFSRFIKRVENCSND